jgi:hypothetical protein
MGVYKMSVLVSPQKECLSLTKTEFLKLFGEMAVAYRIIAAENYDYFVLSGRGLCDGPIPCPEGPYRVCVCVRVRAYMCVFVRASVYVSLSVIKGNNNLP